MCQTNTVTRTCIRPQYITQINAFHRFTETVYLPLNAQLLWFKLIDLCNTSGWQEWIQVDTKRLMRMIGTQNEKAAYRARDALVNAGLLEYRKGHKGCPNRYRFVFFTDKDLREDTAQFGTQCGSQSDRQNGCQNAPDAGDIKRKEKEKTREEIKRIPAELSTVFCAYEEMRGKMRKPLTESARQLVLRTLDSLAPGQTDMQKKILEQSILNGWAGIYPLKEETPEPPASYDVGEIERKLLFGKIEYKKRE